MTILVLGGTGKVGSYVVKELLERKQQVRVLARDANKAKAALGHVEVAVGDVDDLQSVKAALRGAERLFLLTQNQRVEGPIAQAAKEAGVKHIVKLSCIFSNASDPLGSVMRSHGIAENEVISAGVPVTFLRPHDFMQNFVVNDGQAIKTMGKLFHATGNSYIASVDAHDIGACAAAILSEPIEKHAGLSYDITGPEALTRAEQAKIIQDIIGKPVEAVPLSDAQYAQALTSHHLPRPLVTMLVRLGQSYRYKAATPYFTNDVEIILGRPARTLASFIAENKNAFL